jgi:hypothetical protein
LRGGNHGIEGVPEEGIMGLEGFEREAPHPLKSFVSHLPNPLSHLFKSLLHTLENSFVSHLPNPLSHLFKSSLHTLSFIRQSPFSFQLKRCCEEDLKERMGGELVCSWATEGVPIQTLQDEVATLLKTRGSEEAVKMQ